MNRNQKKALKRLETLIPDILYQSDQIRLIGDELGTLKYYSPLFSCLLLPDNSNDWADPPNVEYLKDIQGLDKETKYKIPPEIEKILERFSIVATEVIKSSEPIKLLVANLRKSGYNHDVCPLFFVKAPSPSIH